MDISLNLSFKPLSKANWQDFEHLFGEKGACGGCWCMLWRSVHSEFEKQKGEGNKAAMYTLVREDYNPGILIYAKQQAVAWCSVSPREDFIYFEKTRSLQPVDGQPVWAISCLFIEKAFRRKGISAFLLDSAAKFAASQGARILEAYPSVTKKDKMPDVFAWTGLVPIFERSGFEMMAQRSSRNIMRKNIKPQ